MSEERIIPKKGISNPVNPDSDEGRRVFKPRLPTAMYRESEFPPTADRKYLTYPKKFGIIIVSNFGDPARGGNHAPNYTEPMVRNGHT